MDEIFYKYKSMAEKIAGKWTARNNCYGLKEEILQAAYIGLLDASRRIDETVLNVEPRLYRRIVGSILDELRDQDVAARSVRRQIKQGLRSDIIFVDIDIYEFTEEFLIESEYDFILLRRLNDAINMLPDKLKNIVIMYYAQDLTGIEVANKLNLSEASATKYKNKSINALRKLLSDISPDDV